MEVDDPHVVSPAKAGGPVFKMELHAANQTLIEVLEKVLDCR